MQNVTSEEKIITQTYSIKDFDYISQLRFEFSSGISVELEESHPNPLLPIIIHTPVVFKESKEILTDLISEH